MTQNFDKKNSNSLHFQIGFKCILPAGSPTRKVEFFNLYEALQVAFSLHPSLRERFSCFFSFCNSGVAIFLPQKNSNSFSNSNSIKKTVYKVTTNPMSTQLSIGGVRVEFSPGRQPFPQQLQVMSKIVQACERGDNALLESPTGTGKTLALLCATLSWQKHVHEKNQQSYARAMSNYAVRKQKVDQAALALANNVNANKNEQDELQELLDQVEDLPVAPTQTKIFYSSRTHTQLTQVVGELKRMTDMVAMLPPTTGQTSVFAANRLKMCVLGSRDQSCVNEEALHGKIEGMSVNDACKTLTNNTRNAKFSIDNSPGKTCTYYSGVDYLATKVQTKIVDIEELGRMGKAQVGCPYFVSRKNLAGADIVFLPYSYLIDPGVRKAMALEAHMKGAVIIFDEAHNIEDVCRDAASVEADLHVLDDIVDVLRDASKTFPRIASDCERLANFVGALCVWVLSHPVAQSGESKGSSSLSLNGGAPSNILEGPEALASWQHSDEDNLYFSEDTIRTLRNCLTAISELDEEDENQVADQVTQTSKRKPKDKTDVLNQVHMSLMERILVTLKFLTCENMRYVRDFRIAVTQAQPQQSQGWGFKSKKGGEKEKEKEGTGSFKKRRSGPAPILCLWSMNPAVAFRPLVSSARSLILTSGTLSPLKAFASELGCEFKQTVEATHVCDISKQLFCGSFVRSGHEMLDATYKNASRPEFCSALGDAVLRVARLTPGGLLIFFPSYALLDRSMQRWKETKYWEQLNQIKPIYIETRGSNEEFDRAVAQYRAKCAAGPQGAMFFAVFRGKLSEGIDFKDEYCRAVCIVGIPFPSFFDLKVSLKKAHQDAVRKRAPPSLMGTDLLPLSGSEWYNQQAYRAINQSLGRVIRHRFDYGAIILLDQRFTHSFTVCNLSKWMRGSVVNFDNVGDAEAGLKEFFERQVLGAVPAPDSFPAPPARMSQATSQSQNTVALPRPLATKPPIISARLPKIAAAGLQKTGGNIVDICDSPPECSRNGDSTTLAKIQAFDLFDDEDFA